LLDIQKELRSPELKLRHENKLELEKFLGEEIKIVRDKKRILDENIAMERIESYYNLRNITDEAVQKAYSFETFEEARTILFTAQNALKEQSSKPQKEQKDELFGLIRSTFTALEEKFEEYKRVTPEEAAVNYPEIKTQIDSAIEFVNDPNNSNQASREKLIETQTLIKEARLL